MRSLFSTEVGLSDHTLGIGAAVASIALGASVIEKHFTLSRDDGGVDSAFSLEPNELHALVVESLAAWESLGTIKYGPLTAENASKVFRRSMYVIQDIKKGDVLTTKNIGIIRPGDGGPPSLFEEVIGLKSVRDLPKGTPFNLSALISE